MDRRSSRRESTRVQNVSEDTSSQDQSEPCDRDADESSDESGVNQTADELERMHMDDDAPGAAREEVSNATVAPVDIVNRRSIINTNVNQHTSHAQRSGLRTPSPNGLPSSLPDGVAGSDGPMTPRNDAGPFVFDGSAGRIPDIGSATTATFNLNAAATPQAQPPPTSEPAT